MADLSSLIFDYQSATDWWRAAGVDSDYADDVTTWLAQPKGEPEPAPREPLAKTPVEPDAIQRALSSQNITQIAGQRSDWPTDIAAFREWWVAEPTLDTSRASERVVPRGPEKADLMVVVAMPDAGDTDRLLGGTQGEVLSNFLRVANVDESSLYIASALPRNVAMPVWDDLASAGIAEVLRHHIDIAGPKRVLIFGRPVADMVNMPNDAIEGIPALAAPSFENLARSPGRKRRFWNNWLEWTKQ